MRLLTAFLLLLMIPAAALADPPKAQILGPTGGTPGDILILDATKSAGAEHFAWRVYPELPESRPTLLPLENGAKCIVASVPGTYIVFLAVSNADGLDMVRWVVVVGGPGPAPPGPNPNPPVPVPPTPVPPAPVLTGLAKQVYDASKRINDPVTAGKLAGNFDSIASAIAAGAYNGDLLVAKTKIIGDLKAANSTAVSGKQAWLDLFNGDLRGWMNEREQAGEMRTLPQISSVLSEAAKGFREASK